MKNKTKKFNENVFEQCICPNKLKVKKNQKKIYKIITQKMQESQNAA